MHRQSSLNSHERTGLVGPMILAALSAGCFRVGAPVAPAECSASPARAEPVAALVATGPVDPTVPTPESVIGYSVGERAVRYDALVRYLRALADASPRVTLSPYAESHEGRTLFYLTITGERNQARLATIQADNAKLADPRLLSGPEEAERILDGLPGIAWLAYAIHGDELSSTDAAMQVAYELAAGTDESTRKLRDELVIHIDPLMNPDGRERYLAQLQQLTGLVPNPDYQAMQHWGLWSAGRGNHYLFDLNRDWLPQVHPETRGRAAAIQSWNPHLLVDSHEMGGLDTYLFDPPREPFNVALSETIIEWRRRFSADQAAAFDRHGWSYYTQEWYEEWYPGYSNSWASLLGAVGLLYEQAGVNAASIKQLTGQELTYGEAVQHQVASSFANLETLRANRRPILTDFWKDRRWAVSDSDAQADVYLLPPLKDRSRFDRFVDVLHHQGIETTIAEEPFEAQNVTDVWGEHADRREFPSGTLVIRSKQPHRRLLHAILAFDAHMSDDFLKEERKELETHRGTRVYDVTAWNLSMAYGLEAFWAEGMPTIKSATGPSSARSPDGSLTDAGYGYLIDGASADVFPALVRLLDRGCKPRVAIKPFAIAGRHYEPGAVLLRCHENPEGLRQILDALAADLILDVHPVDTALSDEGPDLGGNRFQLLQPPRVAVASQWPITTTSFGSTWFLCDQRIGLRVSPINVQWLGVIDLRKYNVLVLPDAANSARLAAILDEATLGKIKAWVAAGGTLIAMGDSAAFLASEERGLSSVRLRRDVLDQLAVYEEAWKHELGARHIQIDPARVWGAPSPADATTQPAPSEAGETPKDASEAKPDVESLQREDEWRRLFSPLGAMGTASLDPEHWLCFGLGEKLPVLLIGDFAYMSKHPVATPARLVDQQRLRLSGLLWPEARERFAGTAYATVERVEAGQIILFATDPFFRGYFEGSGRLLLNAMILGPGLGTRATVPW